VGLNITLKLCKNTGVAIIGTVKEQIIVSLKDQASTNPSPRPLEVSAKAPAKAVVQAPQE
jgi:hypothetical protein